MGEQPGDGGLHSYKIRGHSRQRRSTKPYSRPSDRKGVLQSVKDFFSPSWLVDFWKGKKEHEDEEIEENECEDEGENIVGSTVRTQDSNRELYGVRNSRISEETCSDSRGHVGNVFGNGGVRSVATAQTHSQPSRSSGLLAFLASTSKHSSNKETAISRKTGVKTTMDEATRPLDHDPRPSSSPIYSTSTDGESSPLELPTTSSMTNTGSESPSLSFGIIPGPSRKAMPSLFGTSTPMPGSSSTPVLPNTTFVPLSTPSERTTVASTSRPQATSVFRSRPEFSVTAFGSPLPPRTSTSQSNRFSSPYYSGKTKFGGASSHSTKSTKRMRISSPGNLEPVRPNKRQIKPITIAGQGPGGVASQTAKRILETLEKMSSPLVDAKKIPPSPACSTSTSPLSFTQNTRRRPPQQTQRPVGSTRKLQARFGAPPVQALSVPQRAAISRVQPKTHVGSNTTATESRESFSTRPIPKQPSFIPTPLPMSLSPIETSKGGGKIKTAKSSSHYKSQLCVEEEEEEVNSLPQITSSVLLKIPTGASLPSFTFSSASTTKTATSNKPTFAFPTTKSKAPDLTSNNFKFSIPETKAPSIAAVTTQKSPTKTIPYSFSQPAPVNKSDSSTSSNNVPATSTFLDRFKPAEDSWECETCMINNKGGATSCVACSTPKPTSQPNNDLLKKFAPPCGSWSCDTCLLANKSKDEKCLACGMSKPSVNTNAATLPKSVNLLTNFVPQKDCWECDTCMLNNKESDNKCVACQTPKPGGKPSSAGATQGLFGAGPSLAKQFTPSSGSWTCNTCLIVNKPDMVKCLACETAKPGAKGVTSGFNLSKGGATFSNSSIKFGSEKNAELSEKPMFAFGVTSKSDSSTGSATTFKFGSSEVTSASKPSGSDTKKAIPSFTFGAKSDSKTSDSGIAGSVTFGAKEVNTSSKSLFKFGGDPKPLDTPGDAVSSVKFGASTENHQTTVGSTSTFAFGGNSSAATNPSTSVMFGSAAIKADASAPAQPSPKGKMPSIAQAAAAGLLQIPSSVEVVDLTAGKPTTGLQQIPVKGDTSLAPPNVNLFASGTSSPMFSPAVTKPEASNATTMPFAFGASQPADKPAMSFFLPPASTSTPSSTFPKFGQTAAAAPTGFKFGSSMASTNQAPNNPTTSAENTPRFSFTAAQKQETPAGFQAAPSASTSNTAASLFAFTASANINDKFGSSGSSNSTGASGSSGSGFSFSAPAPNAAHGTGGFIFGGGATAAPPAPSAAAPAYVFGTQTTEAPKSGFGFQAPAQPFAFAAAQAAAANNSPGTVMRTASDESMDADGNNNSSQPTVPAFGATQATPSASPFNFNPTPPNTGFNFSASQPQSTFKFGASQTGVGGSSPAPPAYPGGLRSTLAIPAFGANTAPALQQGTSSGGFSFGAPSTNSINAQPSGFSVTAPTPGAFTAGAGVIGKRVIKKGIRRTKRN